MVAAVLWTLAVEVLGVFCLLCLTVSRYLCHFLLVLVLTLLSVVVLPSSVAVSCGASGCS